MDQNNQAHLSGASEKKLGLSGKMARIFVKNSQLTILAIALIATLGLISFIIIPKAYNPDIVAPAFIIKTEFPGAQASQVHELITRPMENAISELPNIDQITSNSFEGGQSVVMVQFKVGTPADSAKIALTQKFKDNMFQKPMGANDPSIETVDPDDVPIATIALTSQTRSPEALRILAYDAADQLKTTIGTSKITVTGGRTKNLQVELDVQKISHLNLSISNIIGILKSTNGIFTTESFRDTISSEKISLNGSIQSPEEAKKIVIIPNKDKPLFLEDIASVYEGSGEVISDVRTSQRGYAPNETAYVSIAKLKGSNISSVSENISAKIEELKQQPEFSGVTFSILRDDGKTASEEIATLTKHLVISVLIVVIILMVFLGLRNSLIVAISIPLTLLASFAIGLFAGQTVNRITLFALILSLGLLVDDAIVIIENIHRTIKNNPGKNRRSLIIEAVNEVGMGVFMSTITILLAFIPMAFVTGMMGPYMGPIPFFVSVTLLVSLIIAFTINPALAATISSHKAEEKENVFTKTIGKIENSYANLIGKLVSNKKKKNFVLGGAVVLLLLSLSLPIVKIVQFRMLPKADKEQFYVYLDMPTGTLYEQTDAVAKQIEASALNYQQVESVESFIGTAPIADFNGLFKGSFLRSQENMATLKINLPPHTQRAITSEKLTLGFRNLINKTVSINNPNAKITFVEDPPGPPVRSTFFIKIQSSNNTLLENVTRDIEKMSREISGIEDLKNSIPQRSYEKKYSINFEKAGRLGIVPADIVQTLHTFISGANIARYNNNQESVRKPEQQFVFVRANSSDRKEISDLSKITVQSATGKAVPISEIIQEVPLDQQNEIDTDNRQNTFYVGGEMGNRSVMYATLDLFSKLQGYHLSDGTGKIVSWSPLGITYENSSGEKVSILFDGEWKLTIEIFRDLGIAMGAALLLIYFVLVLQLKSLITPLLIMATIPLALIGVLFGFALLAITKGTYFNATSMIGVIALAGIVVKNAIIYLAYLDELKEKGLPLNQALMEAGRVRLLPIILTSLTAILGSMTIVADPVWEGLAWSIIFGLSVSTVLTLVIFPLLYQTFEGKKWE